MIPPERPRLQLLLIQVSLVALEDIHGLTNDGGSARRERLWRSEVHPCVRGLGIGGPYP